MRTRRAGPGPSWATVALVGIALAAAPVCARAAETGRFLVWRLEAGIVRAPAGAPAGPLAVGSLTKPFVARAWARSHPGAPTPVVRCDATSGCWRPSGHGTVGLVRATAVSCNAYFRALAEATPRDTLEDTLRSAGFRPPDPLTPDAAIGLPTAGGAAAAAPEAVLRVYATLVREPWAGAEEVRREVLAGLRDSAREGTAAGLARDGFYAKTGTAPAVDGRPLATSGWAVAVDGTGRGTLALLPHGTGREAARRLAGHGRDGARTEARPEPVGAATSADRVRVVLFSALRPRRVVARNLGPAPIATGRGFVGTGAAVELRPADRLGEGDWELSLPESGLVRVLRGAVRVGAGPRDTVRVLAEVTPVEYASGVTAAELGEGDLARLVPLGAAILRFLAAGARHGDADVCDETHCAWFVGRGPRASWPTPTRAVLAGRPAAASAPAAIDAATWGRILGAAREPGPKHWTGHCGGEPLSADHLWGGGDRRVFRCDRHASGDRAAWTRQWSRADVSRAFGGPVDDLRVAEGEARWTLQVSVAGSSRELSWDEAHAALAAVLGWGALPSPADRVDRDGGGFRASGRGLGHRVGLCLGPPDGPDSTDRGGPR